MIRRATPDDARAIASVHRASIMELCVGTYSDPELATWTAGVGPTIYKAPIEAGNAVVAVDNDRIVAFGIFDPSEALIGALYVAPDAVRRGIGRSVMAAIEARLASAGVSEARLNATLNALPFYGTLGYVARGQTTNRLPSGIELPCMAMSKRLVPSG
jgi:GNAT superfamily N-acetyltransferase